MALNPPKATGCFLKILCYADIRNVRDKRTGVLISVTMSRDEVQAPRHKNRRRLHQQGFADTLALPLGYFTDKVVNAGSEEKAFNMMKEGVFVDGMALTSRDTGITYKGGAPAQSAVTEKTPNRIKAKVITDRQGLFVLNVSDYKKWRAYVNGKKADILNVNYNMMAVKVQPGTSDITFIYGSFWDYLLIVISLIFTAGVFVIRKHESIKRRGNNPL